MTTSREVPPETPLSSEIRARVSALLGREPRGLEAVALARPDGTPMVLRVAALVDDAPFPTLFWLVDPELSYAIDRAEADGLIRQLQQRVDTDPQLQRRMAEDHHAHIRLRRDYMSPSVRQRLRELGYSAVLDERGIGGIADFSRIRCLHTWYAAHLIVPNTVGGLLDAWWCEQRQQNNG